MAKRSFDFTANEKQAIRMIYGDVCAACGFDFPGHLEVDHWIPGNTEDDGVCLCSYCNRIKGNVEIPEYLRLMPRKPIDEELREEWQMRVVHNREVWSQYVSKFRGALPKYINSRKWTMFNPPY